MNWHDITMTLLLGCSLLGCMRAWYLEGKIDAYRNMIKAEKSRKEQNNG